MRLRVILALTAASMSLSGCFTVTNEDGTTSSTFQVAANAIGAQITAAVVDPDDANLSCEQIAAAITEVQEMKRTARERGRVDGVLFTEMGVRYWTFALSMPTMSAANFRQGADLRLDHLRRLATSKNCR